jgi:hypothetical protein
LAQVAATASLSSGLNCTVYAGLADEEKLQEPAVICWADRSEEEIFPRSNVFRVNAQIIVREIAPDTGLASSGSLAGAVFSAFLGDRATIENNLTNAAPNYFVFSVKAGEMNYETEGDAYIQTLNLRLTCCMRN